MPSDALGDSTVVQMAGVARPIKEDGDMRERVAIVTGGGRGIGRAISEGLAADGAIVAVNYRRDEAAAKATVDAIGEAGGRAKAYCADVTKVDDCQTMVDAVVAEF